MKKSKRNVLLRVAAVAMAFLMLAPAKQKVMAAEGQAATEGQPAAQTQMKRENVAIGQSVSYTGTKQSGYTFDSSVLSSKETVGAMVFNIHIDLPSEGDVSWNDWCGEAAAVTVGDEVRYYDFGGAQVGWGTDMTGDDNPDTTGVGSASWVGTASNGTCTVVIPVNAIDFKVDFYDNCWDTAADISHFTINSATALYGETASVEFVDVAQELSYTGLEADKAYTFANDKLTTKGNVSAVVINMSVALPMEGDVSWNDWCGEAATVTVGDQVQYYDFGGAQVGWGTDVTKDDTPDTTGVGTASWIGTAELGALSIVVPVNAEEFTIALYDNCWDTAADVPHFKINQAIAVYGTVTEAAPEPTATPEPEKNIPAFDANGTYHAYLGIQSASYIFRNPWNDEGFGIEGTSWETGTIGNNFNGLTGWDNNLTVKKDGTFTDCEIAGNGTYEVGISAFDFGNDQKLNTLFVSTDIPLEGTPVKITDVKVIMNDSTKYTFDNGIIAGVDTDDDKDYYEVHCINIWNKTNLGGENGLFSYALPLDSIKIRFTVSGFAYDKAAEEVSTPAAEDKTTQPEAKPADSKTVETEDNHTAVIVIVIILCVAAAAAVVFVVMKKKKQSSK